MTRNSLENYRKQNMMLFKPAIALMNQLKYPQKFFLISLLFVLPLALVMNFLLSEINSRVEFTQKEIYGNAYLRPISQLWKHIPRRQLYVQRQFYQNSKNIGQPIQLDSQELLNLQNKIDQGFTQLLEVDRKLGNILQTGENLKEINNLWQSLRDSREYSELPNHDLLIEKINRFRLYIIDASNLILDPDLDTYYLRDLRRNKIPKIIEIGI